MKKPNLPIKPFKTQKDWRDWLENNHNSSPGIWLKLYKKDSGMKTVTYAEALDEALCFGWIDGQGKSLDEKAYLQRFTPRRSKSIWSKRNTEHVARLTKLGKMTPAGLAQVAAAKKDGRWERAYNSPKHIVMPDDFMKKLSANKQAHAFFETLNKSNRFHISYQLETAKKPETRERRMKKILDQLATGKRFY